MDRSDLDALYRVHPKIALRKALAEVPTAAPTCRFLSEHVDALSLEQLCDLLRRPHEPVDEWPSVGPFVDRLLELLLKASRVSALELQVALHDVVQLAPANHQSWLDDDAWRGLVDAARTHTSPTTAKPWWWWLADHARGGIIFNALNASPPRFPTASSDFKRTSQERDAPIVEPLLEDPLNDPKAAAYVLTLPMRRVLTVMAAGPELVRREDVESIAAARSTCAIEGDDWTPPLPAWLAPHALGRAVHCGDVEALKLYAWLNQEGQSPDALFTLALERFRLNQKQLATFGGTQVESQPPQSIRELGSEWCRILGTFLATGTAWKGRGREVIKVCIDANLGFPYAILDAALGGTAAHDGASDSDHQRAILRKAHDVAAQAFVERAEAAMRAADWHRAQLSVEALLTLEPGKFLRGAVHHLRSIEGAPEALLASIDACVALLKTGGRDPTKADFLDAFSVLAGLS